MAGRVSLRGIVEGAKQADLEGFGRSGTVSDKKSYVQCAAFSLDDLVNPVAFRVNGLLRSATANSLRRKNRLNFTFD
jgi:hypothetical protein